MIQFATFVNNNARRWERGERDHLACASALLLACGATDAPTNADNLKRLTEQVSGLSNNAAFRSGQLAMQSIVHAAINEIAETPESPESLDRHAVIGKLRRRLNSEFDTLNRSASFAATGKVVPSQTSLEKENSKLREEIIELQKQLAAQRISSVRHGVDATAALCRDNLNNLLVYAASRLDRSRAHGIQGNDFPTAFRLTHELVDRLISRVKNLTDKVDTQERASSEALRLQQESHRASMAALDKHRVELENTLTYFDLRTGVCSTMAETVDMARRGISKMHGELRELRARAAATRSVMFSDGVEEAHKAAAGWLRGLLTQLGVPGDEAQAVQFVPGHGNEHFNVAFGLLRKHAADTGRERVNDTVWSILDANRATTARLKEELAKIADFNVSSIPDYDPSKPGAVCAAVAAAVRTYGRHRYDVGCDNSHSVADGWLVDMMKGIGCSTEELVDLVAETKRKSNGNKAFEVAKTIILRRVLRMLSTIAQLAMPVSLPRPWALATLRKQAIENAAQELVQEIQAKAEHPRLISFDELHNSKLRVLSSRVRSFPHLVARSEVRTLLEHLNLWRE